MIKIILVLAISLFATIANAQSPMKLCYPTTANGSNCVTATSDTPFPVTMGTIPGGAATAANQLLEIAALGATNDAAWAGSGNGSIIAILKGIYGQALVAGTAGTASANVVTVQGIASMTPVQISQATASNLNATVVQATASSLNAAVVGNIAGAATDSGNPVKIGGVFNNTRPTYTTGQRGDVQLGTRGSVVVQLSDTDGTIGAVIGTAADGGTLANSLKVQSVTKLYNGSSEDLAFTCPNTAVVNVTAGNTTEIVALTSSQVIRVCNFSVSMSAAGTAAFVYGTGSNCASGTTSITGAVPLATGTPWSNSGGNGSTFRTASANALCVAAVTGNVVGYVTYVKY